MVEDPKGWLRWFKAKWRTASSAWRLVYLFIGLALLALLSFGWAYLAELKTLFFSAHPAAQSAVLLGLIVIALGMAIFAYDRNERVRALKRQVSKYREQRDAAKSAEKSAVQERQQLEERWDRLSEIESREVLWQRP